MLGPDFDHCLINYKENDIPSVFLPLALRLGCKYKSLSHHKFTSQEKNWICQFIRDNGTNRSCDNNYTAKIAFRSMILNEISIRYKIGHELLE